MGRGSYSFYDRSTRSTVKNYTSVTASTLGDVFEQKKLHSIHPSLDPNGISIRESRDSEDHPESLAIIIAIDFTGSMGSVPAYLVREGLPHMIQKIFEKGIKSPQVSFVGIGDHECDNYPLQVGQFESSDELLDDSLTKMYPEGGGGGNEGESYLLAWFHAARYTSIDCFEKRGQKGILVTIGDEPNLKTVPGSKLQKLYGMQSNPGDITAFQILEEAKKHYEVLHINVTSTSSGYRTKNDASWSRTLGDNFVNVQKPEDIADTIAMFVSNNWKGSRINIDISEVQELKENISTDNPSEEEML